MQKALKFLFLTLYAKAIAAQLFRFETPTRHTIWFHGANFTDAPLTMTLPKGIALVKLELYTRPANRWFLPVFGGKSRLLSSIEFKRSQGALSESMLLARLDNEIHKDLEQSDYQFDLSRVTEAYSGAVFLRASDATLKQVTDSPPFQILHVGSSAGIPAHYDYIESVQVAEDTILGVLLLDIKFKNTLATGRSIQLELFNLRDFRAVVRNFHVKGNAQTKRGGSVTISVPRPEGLSNFVVNVSARIRRWLFRRTVIYRSRPLVAKVPLNAITGGLEIQGRFKLDGFLPAKFTGWRVSIFQRETEFPVSSWTLLDNDAFGYHRVRLEVPTSITVGNASVCLIDAPGALACTPLLPVIPKSKFLDPFSPLPSREHFIIKGKLGQGMFGSAYEAEDLKRKMTVVIKIMDPNLGAHDLSIEPQVNRRLMVSETTNYLKPLEFIDETDIVLPYMKQDLARFVTTRKLTLLELSRTARRILVGLKQIHERGVIHFDLKADNIMLPGDDPNQALIIDFSCACFMDDLSSCHWFYGHPAVASREDISSYATDYWSFGLTMIHLAAGKNAYSIGLFKLIEPPSEDLMKRFETIRNFYDEKGEPFDEATWSSVVDDTWPGRDLFIDLIKTCLNLDPGKIPTSDELLAHPFLQLE